MILREGHLPLLVTAVAAAATSALAGWLFSVPLWLLLAWLLRIYWERRSPVPADPNGILGPVSGRVVSVGESNDSLRDRPAQRVSIAVPLPGVVPLRSPTEGKVMDLYARRGIFGARQRPCRPGESPDCYGQWLRTDEGDDVVFLVSSRWPVSRARFRQAPGERVGQGARAGFFYFASIADLLLPADVTLEVEVGDWVDAGETVVARLRRS